MSLSLRKSRVFALPWIFHEKRNDGEEMILEDRRKERDRIDKSRAIGAVRHGAWYGDTIKRTFYTHRPISINMQRR